MKDKKVVVIGGGTGNSILLAGLKNFTNNITAIVTVADDGGGSGVLRSDLGMLPPGDIRACLLALSNTQEQMEKLFSFRFGSGQLKGQSFGNLFLAAMNEIYGDFGIAVKEASKVLNITGKVLPVTLDKMDLIAELENGKKFLGESAIPKFVKKEKSPIKKLSLENSDVKILDSCIKAVREADLIILGPGSLYTSVIPNLLIGQMVEEIVKSKAKTAYICNVMTQAGETDNYTVADHVRGILKHSNDQILDYCLVNNREIDYRYLKSYNIKDSVQVLPNEEDKKFLEEKNIKLITGDYIDVKDSYIRSNSINICRDLEKILKS
ncbi:MAG: YvcK family protein [Bacillota bacterium]|nr:YvcK family protein [Bacillota bacterium]